MASPLETVVRNWGQRAAQAQAAGIPTSAYKALGKQDIQNVIKGGTPLPNLQANLAIASAAMGHPIINVPRRKTGPLAVLGNIPSDISGIVRGFVPGMARFAFNVAKPSRYGGLPSGVTDSIRVIIDRDYAEKRGFELDKSRDPVGQILRNAARMPLSPLVPGIHTAAALTTGQGRAELQRHPVGTTLDVLPAAVVASEAATAGRVAEAGSTVEALQSGRVLRAGARAVPAAVETGRAAVTEGVRGSSRFSTATRTSARLHGLAMNLGVSPEIANNIARPWTQISRRMELDAKAFFLNEVKPLVDKMDPAERAQLFEEATHYEPASPAISPEHHAILGQVKRITHDLETKGVNEGGLIRIPIPGGKTVTYAMDSAVSKAFRRVNSQAKRLTSADNSVRHFEQQVADREAKIATRQGKVRSYTEDPATFAARPEGPVGPQAVWDATHDVSERFAHLDPLHAFPNFQSLIPGMHGTQYAAVFKSLTRLSGDQGLFARFNEALQANDLKTARQTSTAIAREFKKPSMSQFASGQKLGDWMGEIRDELKGMTGKARSYGYAARQLATAERHLANAQARYQFHSDRLGELSDAFHGELSSTPSASYEPMIRDLVRQGAIDEAQQLFNQGTLLRMTAPKQYAQVTDFDAALTDLRNASSFTDFERYLGPEKFREIMDDAKASWLDIAKDPGVDPIWMHHVAPDRIQSVLHPRPLTTNYATPRAWREKTFNFAPHVTDVGVAITDAAAQILRNKGTVEFIDTHVMRYARTLDDVRAEYLQIASDNAKLHPSISIPAEAERLMRKEWIEFDPNSFVAMSKASVTHPANMVIPKPISNALFGRFGLVRGEGALPLKGAWDKSLNMYKFAVLTGPRHIAHVALGGMTFLMLRRPTALLEMKNAAEMVRNGTMPNEVSRGLYNLNTDQILNTSVGKSLARTYLEAPGKGISSVAHKLARFEEFTSDMYRTSAYLSGVKRGLSTEAAANLANKIFIDLDGMTPVERTVIKQVAPFYAFTKHLFNYLLSYPVDHPIRAAILSRFADQEEEEWNTGIPRQLRYLYYLGEPDHNGNINTVEWKSINPFRSFSNSFTLAGFVSSLNPAVSGLMQASGVNVLDATPELYPDTFYDPESGGIRAKRSNVLAKFAESYFPQFGAIDHFYGLTDGLKRLKEANPGAYRRQLFSSLNLPFAVSQVNIPGERARAERNRYKGAQTAISGAVRSGNYSEANRYDVAPFRGELTPVSEIQKTIEGLRGQLAGGVAPTAVLPRARRRRSQG